MTDHQEPNPGDTMSPSQMAVLLDTAFRMPEPLRYLDGAMSLFRVLGRHLDAEAVIWMGCLLVEGEIEILMTLRSAWKRGQIRCLADIARIAP